MLNTFCVVCGRPLVDAISVQLGIGPECRKQFDGGISEETRVAVNRIVHKAALAAGMCRIDDVLSYADEIEAAGLDVLANRIRRRFKNANRLVAVEIQKIGSEYRVMTPYRRKESKRFVSAWRAIPGRRWERGANVVPEQSKRALWGLLVEFFGGRYGKGPKGLFKIPKPIPAQMEMKYG